MSGSLRDWRGQTRRTAVHALDRAIDTVLRRSARPLLRGVLGRWPHADEIAAFRAAHRAGGDLPRTMHALTRLPAAQAALMSGALQGRMANEALECSSHCLVLAERPRASFMHLEKTAGTSVLRFLLDQYHPAQVLRQPAWDQDSAALLLHDDAARQRALLVGHYDLPFLRAFDPQRFVFTFLREPRSRIVSLYSYWRSWRGSRDGTERHPGAIAAARMDLDAFVQSDVPEIRNAIDNFYARRLTGWSVQPDGDALARPDAQAAALRALEGLDFVGVTEELQAGLQALSARLRLAPPSREPRVNVSGENAGVSARDFAAVAPVGRSARTEAALDRLTSIDAVLYEHARARALRPAR